MTLARRGEQTSGTLHITPHHLIFVTSAPVPAAGPNPGDGNKAPLSKPRELWITYPIINFCTFRPSPTSSRQPSSIRLRGRDFNFVCFYFQDERKARDVYDSIRTFSCKLRQIEKLYAFTYAPKGPEKEFSRNNGGGWSVYDPMREWRRQGVDKNRNWRVSTVNKDYTFSETYPATMAVPSLISDSTLNHAKPYRSRQRIPALTYLHPVNNCSITRCSQPMVGVRGNRNIQDEKLMAAIFNTTRAERPLSGFATPPLEREESLEEAPCPPQPPPFEGEISNPEALEDAVISKLRQEDDDVSDDKKPRIYGAQQRNMIIDARPTINAMAMTAMGAGSENMDNYKFAAKAYLGIDNIHVMRDSLHKVVDALKDSDISPLSPSREALHNSKWLKHIANMMDGVGLIARQVGLQHSHVLIHCSDGWDRTSQLSALSQICLDPYYRTLEGFIVLVEKDWVSFGHRFRYRNGPLGSDKWFHIENERVTARNDDDDRDDEKDRGRAADAFQGAQKSLGNAFLSAKGWFKQDNDSRDSLAIDSENDVPGSGDAGAAKRVSSASGKDDKSVTKVKEISPIFHQFLDATYQLQYQYPTRFEFSERFLRRLLYHLYSCQYGTFLFDNEKDRREGRASERTRSVWDYFLSRKQEFLNPKYDPVVDDNVRGKERLIFPRVDEVRWWNELFNRTDEEMNGGLFTKQGIPVPAAKPANGASDADSEMSSYGMPSHTSVSGPISRARTPVLIGVETAEAAIGVGALPAKVDEVADNQQKLMDPARGSVPDLESAAAALEATFPMAQSTPQQQSESEHALYTSQHPPSSEKTTATSDVDSHQLHKTSTDDDTSASGLIESAPQQQQAIVEENNDAAAMDALPDGLDPLGIGEVKDHVPATTSRNRALEQRQEKRKMQMDALLQ